ncbi:MAG TPA: hypothetical protein VHB79_37080 [Polyangiaceae bacterium]|nr:hypothetical protein [Polyangiaceae bacterium]
MPRFACLVALSAVLAWSSSSRAQPGSCPSGSDAWVEVIFSGSAWSDGMRDGVIRELRTELARRSLQVCPEAGPAPTRAPKEVVTLLASDADHVSIVGSNLANEGGFNGRTILVSAIPEDARSLAIAQAVDEALRNSDSRSEPAPAVEPTSPPRRPPASSRDKPRATWFLATALAPTLQVAPPAAQREHAVVAPGIALRLSMMGAVLGGSLGVAITRASDLTFDDVTIRSFRVPLDLSASLRLARGAAQGTIDIGLVAALASYEQASASRSNLELGGRIGLRFGWGRRVVPWIGTSLELLPRATNFEFTPTGTLGHAPSLWLGFTIGTEVKWP